MSGAWAGPVVRGWGAVVVALLAVAVVSPGLRGAILDPRLAVILVVWGAAWALNAAIAAGPGARRQGPVQRRLRGMAVALIFGLTLLTLWEMAVRLYAVPAVILPAPTQVMAQFGAATAVLWADFVQTILKGALSGYVIGCLAAFLTAIVIDRSAFLQRGLLPVGNFIAALPIVGIAPILVMWFGFDWHSKAAVVVVMVFFPMLVNCVEGLKASDPMQRDLMATWSASYVQSLLKLRLPAAMPFVFNGLKIASTLALIGAIVAEFFGSPVVGMGFRISAEAGRMRLDMVWAEIAVAALAGSAFYGLLAILEKRVTFWHPSQRSRS